MTIYKVDADKIRIDTRSRPKSEPILWFRAGLFCIIPIEIIQNAIDNLNMYQRLSGKTLHPIIEIFWDQGIPVDPKVGYALMGE